MSFLLKIIDCSKYEDDAGTLSAREKEKELPLNEGWIIFYYINRIYFNGVLRVHRYRVYHVETSATGVNSKNN